MSLAAGCVLLLMMISAQQTVADNEFETVPKMYEEIGCKEIKSAENGGSSSFECPELVKYDANKCHLKGKSYNVGDEITGDDEPHCRAACRCYKNEGDTAAHIVCADVECPENFHRNWACISQYDDLKSCCRTGEICDEKMIRSLNTCEVERKSYRRGERIYPDKSCYECLCTPDFNNQTKFSENADCRRIDCGIELRLSDIQAGCVPVYYKTPGCCPIEYKCPSKDDAIESHAAAGEARTCSFGDLTLKRGDNLVSQDKCTKCQCAIPPFVTCIKSC